MKRRILGLTGVMALFLMALTVFGVWATEEAPHPKDGYSVVWFEGFEDGILPSQWGVQDLDGDGYNWEVRGGYSGHHGQPQKVVSSQSYNNDANDKNLTPDNQLTLPAFDLEEGKHYLLSFWARGKDDQYYKEVFGIYITVDGTTVPYGTDYMAEYEWQEIEIDLSEYAGKAVTVSIRHYNCTGQDTLLLDCFTLYEKEPVYKVTFDANGGMGSMAEEEHGGEYVLPACGFTREGYLFAGWATEANGEALTGTAVSFKENKTLYAKWIKDTGDFSILGDEDGYIFYEGVLTFLRGGEYTLQMKNGLASTEHTVRIQADGPVRLILNNVRIEAPTGKDALVIETDAALVPMGDVVFMGQNGVRGEMTLLSGKLIAQGREGGRAILGSVTPEEGRTLWIRAGENEADATHREDYGTCSYAELRSVYVVSYTDGAGGTVFSDVTHILEEKNTPTPVYTPTRVGYRFMGWSPVWEDTVTASVTYVAQWQEKNVLTVDTSRQTYQYTGNAASFRILGTVTEGFTVTYSATPVDPGTYTVTVHREEDEVYKEFHLVLPDALTVEKTTPTLKLHPTRLMVSPGQSMSLTVDLTYNGIRVESIAFDGEYQVKDTPVTVNSVTELTVTIPEDATIGDTVTVRISVQEGAYYTAAEEILTVTVGVPDLSAELEELRRQVEDLKEQTVTEAELSGEVRKLEEKLRAYASLEDLTVLREEITDLQRTFARKADLDEAIATLTELTEEDGILEGLDGKITAVRQSLEALTAEQGRLALTESTVSSLEEALDTLTHTTVPTLSREMEANKDAIDTLSSALTALEGTLSSLKEKDRSLEAALREVTQKVGELSDTLDGLKERIRANEIAIGELKTQLSGLASTYATKESVQTVLTALTARLNALEVTDGEHTDDIEDLWRAVHSIKEVMLTETKLNQAKAELEEALAAKADGGEMLTALSQLREAITEAERTAGEANGHLREELIRYVEDAIRTVETAIGTVVSDLAEAERRMNDALATKADSVALSNQFSLLTQRIAQAEQAAEEADGTLRVQLEKVKAAAERTLAQAVTAIDQELERAKRELQEILEAGGDTEKKVEELREALEQLESAYQSADTSVRDQLAESIRGAQELLSLELEDLNDTMDALRYALQSEDVSLRREIAALRTSLRILETSAEKRSEELEAGITEAKALLDEAITRIGDELLSAREELEEAMNQGDQSLEQKILDLDTKREEAEAIQSESLREEIAAAKSTLEAALKATEARLTEAVESLTLAIRQGDDELSLVLTQLSEALRASEAACRAAHAEAEDSLSLALETMKAELTANAAQGDEAVTALLIEKLTALQREMEALKEELKTVREKAKEERENAEEAIEEAERQTDEKITKATKEAQILPSTVATLSLSSNAALYLLLRRKRR